MFCSRCLIPASFQSNAQRMMDICSVRSQSQSILQLVDGCGGIFLRQEKFAILHAGVDKLWALFNQAVQSPLAGVHGLLRRKMRVEDVDQGQASHVLRDRKGQNRFARLSI